MENRYFTGIPCKRGHVCERYASNNDCVECTRERTVSLLAQRKAKYQANRRAKYASDAQHRQRINERNKAARDLKRDEINAARREKWRCDEEWRDRQKSKAAEQRAKPGFAEGIRKYQRQWRYGISDEMFDRAHQEQDGKCAVCRKPEKLVVDHCHATHVFRGLLCVKCNAGLGQFCDDPAALRAAADYLERPHDNRHICHLKKRGGVMARKK